MISVRNLMILICGLGLSLTACESFKSSGGKTTHVETASLAEAKIETSEQELTSEKGDNYVTISILDEDGNYDTFTGIAHYQYSENFKEHQFYHYSGTEISATGEKIKKDRAPALSVWNSKGDVLVTHYYSSEEAEEAMVADNPSKESLENRKTFIFEDDNVHYPYNFKLTLSDSRIKKLEKIAGYNLSNRLQEYYMDPHNKVTSTPSEENVENFIRPLLDHEQEHLMDKGELDI